MRVNTVILEEDVKNNRENNLIFRKFIGTRYKHRQLLNSKYEELTGLKIKGNDDIIELYLGDSYYKEYSGRTNSRGKKSYAYIELELTESDIKRLVVLDKTNYTRIKESSIGVSKTAIKGIKRGKELSEDCIGLINCIDSTKIVKISYFKK